SPHVPHIEEVIRVDGVGTASGGTPDARLAITVQTGNLEHGMEAVKLLLTGTLRRNRGRASPCFFVAACQTWEDGRPHSTWHTLACGADLGGMWLPSRIM